MGKCHIRRRGLGWLLAGLIASAAPALAQCSDDVVVLRGAWGQARFNVELADDFDERSRGLMHREAMPTSAGMLFLYDQPHHAVFWMRNTLIPLDMLFIDPQGRVLRIHENAIPLDETQIDGGTGVSAVLEINGGLAARIGIAVGSQVRHPAFGDAALWPC